MERCRVSWPAPSACCRGRGHATWERRFDTVIRSFRNYLFPANQDEAGVPADLLAQFPVAEEGWSRWRVVVWRMSTY